MKDLLKKHLWLIKEIRHLQTEQSENDYKAAKQITESGEFELLTVNWSRVKRYCDNV